MDFVKYLIYFITRGIVTTTIVFFEQSGMTLISRLAALFPVFTWLAYLFIGSFGAPQQVSEHAKFVLIGTIISWVPYMLAIIYLSPKFGVHKAILIAISIFIIIALVYSYIYLKLF